MVWSFTKFRVGGGGGGSYASAVTRGPGFPQPGSLLGGGGGSSSGPLKGRGVHVNGGPGLVSGKSPEPRWVFFTGENKVLRLFGPVDSSVYVCFCLLIQTHTHTRM